MIEDWSMDEVMAGLADGSIILVDVREPHEFTLGHIPGSVSMPLSQFDPSALPDEPGRRLVFSCAAGVRSQHAIALARAAGLAHGSHFGGGFKEWFAAGGPVERS